MHITFSFACAAGMSYPRPNLWFGSIIRYDPKYLFTVSNLKQFSVISKSDSSWLFKITFANCVCGWGVGCVCVGGGGGGGGWRGSEGQGVCSFHVHPSQGIFFIFCKNVDIDKMLLLH